MCQGFSHFPVFFHHFVLAKLATSSIRVKISSQLYFHMKRLTRIVRRLLAAVKVNRLKSLFVYVSVFVEGVDASISGCLEPASGHPWSVTGNDHSRQGKHWPLPARLTSCQHRHKLPTPGQTK